MTLIAQELERKLQSVDKDTAQRLERLVRDAMDLAKAAPADEGVEHGRKLAGLFSALDAVRHFSAAGRLGREELHAR
ncbi:MAG TPA: hypothetical protein VEO95_13255 [Chthoniobacteraceae bacterium]|nr:hypothetical protein [Chthoniobacteraceae bacterium]